MGGGGAREGLNEDYTGRGLRTRGIEALDADWHFGKGGELLCGARKRVTNVRS